MGHIRNILAERHIGKNRLYSDHIRLEISEALHLHLRDWRLIFDTDEMEVLKDVMVKGFEKWKEMGSPEGGDNPYMDFTVLAEQYCKDEGFHADRLAVEEEEDSSIHLHFGGMRLHLKPADFLILAQQMWLAYLQYNRLNKKSIFLATLDYHPVVDEYIKELKNELEHEPFSGIDEDYVDVIENHLACKSCATKSLGTVKRPDGLPKNFPGSVKEEDDICYLLSLWASMRRDGYAEGPYKHQLMRVYKQKDGTLFAKDSHRMACLLHLGYKKVDVLIIEEESGWRE